MTDRTGAVRKRRNWMSMVIQNQFKAYRQYEVGFLFRQIAMFSRSGRDLVQGLEAIAGELENRALAAAVADVAARMKGGATLSEAMAFHPRQFDPAMVASVKAGEEGGDLEGSLLSASDWLLAVRNIRSVVLSALVYPAEITVFTGLVMLFLMTKVIPMFRDVYMSFGARLPWQTDLVISISYHSWLIFLAVLVAVAVCLFLNRFQPRIWQALLLRIPLVKRPMETFLLGRFCATLSLLIRSGVPMTKSLRRAADSAGAYYAPRVLKTAERVEAGASLSKALEQDGIFPPLLVWHIRSGEMNQDMAGALREATETYLVKSKSLADMISSVVEPAVIVITGLAVGAIVMSLFMPMFSLGTLVG